MGFLDYATEEDSGGGSAQPSFRKSGGDQNLVTSSAQAGFFSAFLQGGVFDYGFEQVESGEKDAATRGVYQPVHLQIGVTDARTGGVDQTGGGENLTERQLSGGEESEKSEKRVRKTAIPETLRTSASGPAYQDDELLIEEDDLFKMIGMPNGPNGGPNGGPNRSPDLILGDEHSDDTPNGEIRFDFVFSGLMNLFDFLYCLSLIKKPIPESPETPKTTRRPSRRGRTGGLPPASASCAGASAGGWPWS